MTATVALFFIFSGGFGIIFTDYFIIDQSIKEKMPYIAIGWPELTTFAFFIQLLHLFLI